MDGDVRGQDNWWEGGWVTQFEGPVSSTRRYDYQVALLRLLRGNNRSRCQRLFPRG